MSQQGNASYEVTKADGSREQVRADAAEIMDSGALVFSTRTYRGQIIDVVLAIAQGSWQQVRRLRCTEA